TKILEENKGKSIPAVVIRDSEKKQLSVNVSADGKLGVVIGQLEDKQLTKLGYYKATTEKYSFLESIPVGIQKGKDQLAGYGRQLQMIFSPETGAYKSVGGFYAIFNIFPDQWSWEAFWSITAILSIMLGVMNLLPIPALDGGHVMFLL